MMNKVGTLPCPDGCLTCTEHLTRPCCVLLEVTQRCNLGCPVCYAASVTEEAREVAGPDNAEDPSLTTIAGWYEQLYKQAGACHIQLSGGEPTLRDDLDEIIRLGKAKGFSYFQLNTNGLRLAEDPQLARRLREAGLTCVFLQFDGTHDTIHQTIRGTHLQAIKEAAVSACAEARLPVILVPTLIGGINEQELWPLVQFGIANSPTVRGIHIQPMAWFGRSDILGTRLTNADVIDLLCKQSQGMLCSCHFSGGNAEHADCSFNAHYFITDTGELGPSGVQRSSCCGDAVEHAQDIQARRWGTDLSEVSEERPPEGSMDEFLWQTKARSFAITGMAFMDEETFDANRMRQCYLFILNPEGVPVPFCAYNMAHRGKVPVQQELAYSYRVQSESQNSLAQQELRSLQLKQLNETITWARSHSEFHRKRLPSEPLANLDEMALLPLMDETDLAGGMSALLCLPQDKVSRIVTAATSGTTGEPKRIAFTRDEQSDIVRYLAAGMRMLAEPGETIAVLYPCDHAGGLGQLICKGIELTDMRAYAYGLPTKDEGFAGLAHTCIDNDIRALVGFPQHINAFLNWSKQHKFDLPVQSVLLSADTVAASIKKQLRDVLGYKVFAHYGTTEMGYGGAVECTCAAGQHIRETDLLFEIVDPVSGEVVPEGEWGELVFTTLNRKAMPLIRYRTGDMSRFIPGTCDCGSILRRIDNVEGRVDELLAFTMYDLEEVIFANPQIMDFYAQWSSENNLLSLELQKMTGSPLDLSELRSAVSKYTGVDVQLHCTDADEFNPLYPGKRFVKRVD